MRINNHTSSIINYLNCVLLGTLCYSLAMPYALSNDTNSATGKAKTIIKLDAYYNDQKVGSTSIPEGRDVKIVNSNQTHYHVEFNPSTHGWINKNDITVLESTPEATEATEETSVSNVNATTDSDPSDLPPFSSTDTKESTESNNTPQNQDQLNQTQEIIRPGELVFLGIKFEEQARGGICAGSSILNIVEYMGSRFKLTQEEFFSLFNSGRSGASLKEMEWGLSQIGFSPWPLYIRSSGSMKPQEEEKIIQKIMTELDSRAPLSISRPGHAFVLVGYNLPERKFYAWDQNKSTESESVKKTIPNAPNGTFEIPMSSIFNKLDSINRIYGVYYYESSKDIGYICDFIREEGKQIAQIANIKAKWNLFPHQFAKEAGTSERDYKKIGEKNIPTLLKGLIKNKREIAIPSTPFITEKKSRVNGDKNKASNRNSQSDRKTNRNTKRDSDDDTNSIIFIKEFKNDLFIGVKQPEGKEVALSDDEVSELLLSNGQNQEGRYWSFDPTITQ